MTRTRPYLRVLLSLAVERFGVGVEDLADACADFPRWP